MNNSSGSSGNILVCTDKGLLRVNEIENIKDLKCSVHKIGHLPSKKIFTKDGNELESSLNHIYTVVEDGKYTSKKVEELKVGDNLVVHLGGYPEKASDKLFKLEEKDIKIKQPEFLSADIAHILALVYRSGKIESKNKISFHPIDFENHSKISKILSDIFGFEETYSIGYTIVVINEDFIRWLTLQGCFNNDVPYILRTASKNNIISFMENLWEPYSGYDNYVSLRNVGFGKELLVLARSIGYNVQAMIGNICCFCRRAESRTPKERIYGDYWLDPIEKIENSSCDIYSIENEYILGSVLN
jgi:hypothetical protein